MAIKVLDKHVAELIAAGEAVERPASVIKELVENSIDAGATSITVEIRNGGTAYMRVTDNGSGIPHSQVPTAFLRHATSKVSNELDLQKIGTLGFRGEALASVCAVAKVQMLTSTGDGVGTEYIIEGGEEKEYSESGCPKGTTIIVRDLFYNTPARMKFLKTDMGEGTAVAGVIDKIALSHPEISFKFIRDSKQVLVTPGSGDLTAAAYAVYGSEFVNTAINVDYSIGEVRVFGLVSKPNASRKSRSMQHFYINGRYIRSGTLTKAIENAYKNSIMVGRFAACVLFVEMPYELVDINVHPAKMECRFSNDRPIFEAVYFGVKSAIEQDDGKSVLKLPFTSAPAVQTVTKGEQIGLHNIGKSDSAKITEKIVSEYMQAIKPAIIPQKPIVKETVLKEKQDFSSLYTDKLEEILDEAPAETPDVKFIGEVFKTYIICECGEDIIIIDKHAAHERMIYENLKSRKYNDEQILLPAVSVTLSKEECDAIIRNTDKLTELGFEIEYFGGSSVLVRSVPMILADCNIKSLIEEISAGFIEHSNKVEIEHLDWLYSNMSCRAAVKGGDINGEDLEIIAKRVAVSGDIKYCPHGRPVAYKLTKRELDKQFGRLG